MKDQVLRECAKIQNDDIRSFAETAINQLPDYFFVCAASSTGKYHPGYAQGNGGLARHTIAAVRFAYHIFQLEQNQTEFNERERDCVIAALLLHDGWKHGNNGSTHTVHEHPLVCADWIRGNDLLKGIIPAEDEELICSCIESHMGQWNKTKRSHYILPKPVTALQKLTHLADYLASRKDIEVVFEEADNDGGVSMDDYKMPFGKYKGRLFVDVARDDPDYLRWLKDNVSLRDPLKTYVTASNEN